MESSYAMLGKVTNRPGHFVSDSKPRDAMLASRHHQTANGDRHSLRLVPISTKHNVSVNRKLLAKRHKMQITPVTSHIHEVTQRDMHKAAFDIDRRNAFRQSKMASLRRSPAYVVWPRRPVLGEVSAFESDTHEGTTVTSEDDVLYLQAGNPQPRKAQAPSVNSLSLGLTQVREQLMALRQEFWDNAYGSVRIDSIFLGNPRFDPYQSKWPPDFRRCFFMSHAKPYHTKTYHPEKIMADNYARIQEEKKESKTPITPRKRNN